MRDKPTSLMPHVTFCILLALSYKPRHGYELMQQITQDSVGRINLGPGALYGTLKKLAAQNLIEAVPSEKPHDRRHYHRLTKKGWDQLSFELRYYEYTVVLAKQRRVISSIFD